MHLKDAHEGRHLAAQRERRERCVSRRPTISPGGPKRRAGTVAPDSAARCVSPSGARVVLVWANHSRVSGLQQLGRTTGIRR